MLRVKLDRAPGVYDVAFLELRNVPVATKTRFDLDHRGVEPLAFLTCEQMRGAVQRIP